LSIDHRLKYYTTLNFYIVHFNNNNIGIFIGRSEKISISLAESLAYYIMDKSIGYNVYSLCASDILETDISLNHLF